MTPRPGDRHPAGRRLRLVLGAAALAVTLVGCGGGRVQPVSDPVADALRGGGLDPAIAAGALTEAKLRAETHPSEPYWPFRAAQVHAALGEIDDAEAALVVALTRDPDHEPSLALLSKLYYESGRHEEALAILEGARQAAAEQGRPFHPTLDAALALHYDMLGELGLAHETVEHLQDRGVSDDEVGGILTFVTLRGETPTEGATMAEASLDRADDDPVHWNNAGVSRLQRGDVAGARDALERAASLDPTLAGPHYNLAILYKFFLLDDGAASESFARYRTLSTDDPDGLAEVFDADPAPTLAERDAPAAAEVPTVALDEEES